MEHAFGEVGDLIYLVYKNYLARGAFMSDDGGLAIDNHVVGGWVLKWTGRVFCKAFIRQTLRLRLDFPCSLEVVLELCL